MNTIEQRFDVKHAPTPSGGWEWTAGTTSSGYGAFWTGSMEWPQPKRRSASS